MSTENYRQNLVEQMAQQYEFLKELDQKINVEVGTLERAKYENDKKTTQANIERIQRELEGLAATAPTQVFRSTSINLSNTDQALIGRERELATLDQMFSKGGSVAIVGLGGQGKSALAYAYLKPFINPQSSALSSQSFEAVVWVQIRGQGTDLGKILELVGLIETGSPEDSAENLRQYLTTHPMLLVLDNFEEAIKEDDALSLDIAALLPKLSGLQGASRVLITSREVPEDFPARKVLRLEGLSQNAGADLLAELGLDSEPREQLEEASRKAGGHPFALRLLAGLATDNATSDTLETLLREGDMWDRELAEDTNLLSRTWDTRLYDEEQRLLKLVAILRPPIRYQTLYDLYRPADDVEFRDLLNGLVAKTLLTLEYDNTDPKKLLGYDMHPIFRRFIIIQQLSESEQTKLQRSAIKYFKSLIPTLPSRDEYERTSIEDIWCILEAIYLLNAMGDYEAATDLFFEEQLNDDLSQVGQSALLVELYSEWAKVESWQDPNMNSIILRNIGLAYADLGETEQAISYYQQTIDLARENSDKETESDYLGNLGAIYSDMGQYDEAISYHKQALAIARELEIKESEARHLDNLGLSHASLGQYEQAITYHEQALTIAREFEDKAIESDYLNSLASTYSSSSEFEEAISRYKQALGIDKELDNKQAQARDLSSIGEAYTNLGQIEQAITYHEQALTIAREFEDREAENFYLNNLGLTYLNSGQHEQAITYFQQALAIVQELEDKESEHIYLNNLGLDYTNLSQYEQAIGYHQQALAIVREIEDRKNESNYLNNLGLIYADLGQHEQAITHHQQALTIAREIEDRESESDYLDSLGMDYNKLGQYEQAITYFQQALTISREISYKSGEESNLAGLGEAYLNLGQLDEATKYLEESVALNPETEAKDYLGQNFKNLGVLYEKQNDLPKAIANWRYSLDILTEIKHVTVKKTQEYLDKLREKAGQAEFDRLWADSEPIYQGLKSS